MTRPSIRLRDELAVLLRERSACLFPATAAALCLLGARGLYALAAQNPAPAPLLGALLLCGMAVLLTAAMIGQIGAENPVGAAYLLGMRRGGVWRLLGSMLIACILVAGFVAMGVWVTVAGTIERGSSVIVRSAIWQEALLRPRAELRWTFTALLALGIAVCAWFLPGAFYRAALSTGHGMRGPILKERVRELNASGGRWRMLLRIAGLIAALWLLGTLAGAIQAASSFSRIGDVPAVHLPMLAMCIPQGFMWMLFWMSIEAQVKIQIRA